MAQFQQWYDQDFTQKIEIRHCESVMFTGDDKGVVVGVHLFDEGAAYSAGGTVTGAVKRSDGGLVGLTGTLSGNDASVVIPAAALSYPGPIGVHIILNQGGSVTTVLKAIYSVDDSSGEAVDPGIIVPSINDLITAINTAVASIPSDYSALLHTLALDFSASTAYVVGDYVWYNGALYCFTANHAAGTWTGTDANAAVVGNDLSNLKSAFESLDETVNGETVKNFTSGKKLDTSNGSLVDDPTRCVSDKIPYTWTGSTRFYCGDNTSTSYSICFYDASDNLLQRYQNPANAGGTEYRNVNGENVTGTISYVRFDFKKDYTGKVCANDTGLTPVYYEAQSTQSGGLISEISEMGGELESAQAAIESAQNDVAALSEVALTNINRTDDVDVESWTSGYVTKGGSIRESDTLVYSNAISVNAGDKIRTFSQARYITAYSAGNPVSAEGKEFISEFDVPDGIDEIIITLTASKSRVVTRTYAVTVPALTPRVEALERIVDTTSGAVSAKAQTITNDTIKAIESVDVRKNLDIEFRGNISSFTFLTIGHGIGMNYAAYIVIDDTNITVYKNDGEQVGEAIPHGLTIGKYLNVLIQNKIGAATITIITETGRFKQENVEFNSRRGDVFSTVNGTMTNVYLSAVIHDIVKPVWVFGDSYQSLDSSARWPYYLADDGYIENCLFSGFPGANATHQIASFRKLIALGQPKYLIWAIGMNGADDDDPEKEESDRINADWKSCTDEVIATCEEKGVEVILATIPNVPERVQVYKNAYVKASGERYIDFAKAVGAEEKASYWYNWGESIAMLSNDQLHPTSYGAMALYSAVLADAPEVMQ